MPGTSLLKGNVIVTTAHATVARQALISWGVFL